jgi:predicted dehydrogenase
MLRAAIVGLGWWGRNLVTSVQGKSKDISFVVAQTRTPSKVQDFCRDNHIRLVDDYESVLANDNIDAVVLATPHSQHVDQVKRAAAAGKHIFCEKPFALTARSAKQAIDAAAKAKVVLAVGFNRRFSPSIVELRKRVRDGRLGVIGSCIGEHTAFSAPNIQPGAWRADPSETPAGAMTGIGVHTVDTMIDLFGRIAEVHCLTTRRAGAHVDDTNAVLLKFNDGVVGMFFASIAAVPNYRFAVYGTKAFAEVLKPTLEEFRFLPMPDPKAGHLAAAQPQVMTNPGFDTLHAELTAFAEAVRGGKPFPVTADEVLHGVEVFEAIVKSAKAGKPVALRK